MLENTKKYQVELRGDLLMVRAKGGELLRATTVPVVNAVELFKDMVKRVKEIESE